MLFKVDMTVNIPLGTRRRSGGNKTTRKSLFATITAGRGGFVNGMVASHLLCHSGTINRHSLNGALLS
jgi:hypothetical protein